MIPTEDSQVEWGRVDSSLASPFCPSVFPSPSFPAFTLSLQSSRSLLLYSECEVTPTYTCARVLTHTHRFLCLNTWCPADSAGLIDCVAYKSWSRPGGNGSLRVGLVVVLAQPLPVFYLLSNCDQLPTLLPPCLPCHDKHVPS